MVFGKCSRLFWAGATPLIFSENGIAREVRSESMERCLFGPPNFYFPAWPFRVRHSEAILSGGAIETALTLACLGESNFCVRILTERALGLVTRLRGRLPSPLCLVHLASDDGLGSIDFFLIF